MAEQSIRIKIAGREYPLKVTSPEQEEVIRKAADDIRKMTEAYQQRFKDKQMIEILSLVALNVCISNITLNRQIKNLEKGEEALAKEISGYLENIDRNSR
ncbi:MAG: cell division protein ZapA [Bacteroidales bacterium]|nr:cell division protein ZapA [Bacteroidales bacterium]